MPIAAEASQDASKQLAADSGPASKLPAADTGDAAAATIDADTVLDVGPQAIDVIAPDTTESPDVTVPILDASESDIVDGQDMQDTATPEDTQMPPGDTVALDLPFKPMDVPLVDVDATNVADQSSNADEGSAPFEGVPACLSLPLQPTGAVSYVGAAPKVPGDPWIAHYPGLDGLGRAVARSDGGWAFGTSFVEATDPLGKPIWQVGVCAGSPVKALAATPNGGLVAVALDGHTFRLGGAGATVWIRKELPGVHLFAVRTLPDGGSLSGGETKNQNGLLVRRKLDGTLLWRVVLSTTFTVDALAPIPGATLCASGTAPATSGLFGHAAWVGCFDNAGIALWKTTIKDVNVDAADALDRFGGGDLALGLGDAGAYFIYKCHNTFRYTDSGTLVWGNASDCGYVENWGDITHSIDYIGGAAAGQAFYWYTYWSDAIDSSYSSGAYGSGVESATKGVTWKSPKGVQAITGTDKGELFVTGVAKENGTWGAWAAHLVPPL